MKTQAEIRHDIRFWQERLATADKQMSRAYAEVQIKRLQRELALLTGE